jgi:antitoxin YefM
MKTLNYSAARQGLTRAMNTVVEDCAPLLITRAKGGDCVLMSLADYESLEETAYLLRSPANAARLLKAVHDAQKGVKGVSRSIEALEAMEAPA